MIGASGAIAGVLGAYFYLFPKAKVLVLIPFIISSQSESLPIFYYLFGFVINLLILMMNNQVAWFAHIGGFIFGLMYVFKEQKNLKQKKEIRFLKNKKGPWD